MTVRTYKVGLRLMPVGIDAFEFSLYHERSDTDTVLWSGKTPAYEFNPKSPDGYKLGQAAVDVVKEYNDKAEVIHGTRVVYSEPQLNFYSIEVDVEYPDEVRTGVPTSSFQTWLDNYGVDSDRVDWASDVAIQLLSALGYAPEDISNLGDEISDEPQTLLMQLALHCPAFEYAADIMEAIVKYGGYIKPGSTTSRVTGGNS